MSWQVREDKVETFAIFNAGEEQMTVRYDYKTKRYTVELPGGRVDVLASDMDNLGDWFKTHYR